jgi:hypothetical protein
VGDALRNQVFTFDRNHCSCSPEYATYEALVALLVQNQETEHFTGRFRPTAARMKTIARKGAELLANASEEELAEFSE